MHRSTSGATEPGSPTSDPGDGDPQGASSERRSHRYRAVWWALGFGALTTVGLGVLTWGIVIAHVLAYGVGAVAAPHTIAAVDSDRYRLAFAVGGLANLASASTLAWLAARTPARRWNPVVQGLSAAFLAAVAAVSALLLTLGMNPIAFVASLVG